MEDLSSKKDEDIVFLVQSGKTGFFGVLVSRYEKRMRRYARKFLSDREDINDILQDIFIKAFVNIQSFDAKRKFSPWLYRIAHNELINKLKKKKTLPLFDLDAFFPQNFHNGQEEAESAAEENETKKETKEMIDKCLNGLELKYREPVILYYLEGLSYKEVADVMRIPVSTVGVRIKRAKQKMKGICRPSAVIVRR